ncbi:hypothetical protein Ciccas_006153 [Cichlidogyrus casuarinus]|uniref:Rootletin-like coiled-coil domain-containing protein n=1 Tax=Cichlidogyrus casuarinus TaxID=1844966 RepID=A0ABD2QAE5_9PLAT
MCKKDKLVQNINNLRNENEKLAKENDDLGREVSRLTEACQEANEALEKRELALRDEEAAFNEYFTAEHYKLLAVWKSVVQLRKQFLEMKKQNETDLEQTNTEIMQNYQIVMMACKNCLDTQQHTESKQADASLKISELQTKNKSFAESISLLKQQLQDAETLTKSLKNDNELLKDELEARDRILSSIEKMHTCSGLNLDMYNGEAVVSSPGQFQLLATKRMLEQNQSMKQALQHITQIVIRDAESTSYGHESHSRLKRSLSANMLNSHSSNSSPMNRRVKEMETVDSRSSSPVTVLNGSHDDFVPSTVHAVQTCLNERALQVESLRMKLKASEEHLSLIQRRASDMSLENDRLNEARRSEDESYQSLRKELDLAFRERDRLKNNINFAQRECEELNKVKSITQEQLDDSKLEQERLRKKVHENQLLLDQTSRDLEDCRKHEHNLNSEKMQLLESLNQSNQRYNDVWGELVICKQRMSQMEMDMELLESCKIECCEDRVRCEAKIIEYEVKLKKSRDSENNLRLEIQLLETLHENEMKERYDLDNKTMSVNQAKTKLSQEVNELKKEQLNLQDEISQLNEQVLDYHNENKKLKVILQKLEKQKLDCDAESLQSSKDRIELADALAQSDRERVRAVQEADDANREVCKLRTRFEQLTSEHELLVKEKTNSMQQFADLEAKARDLKEKNRNLLFAREALQASLMQARIDVSDRTCSENQSLHMEISSLRASNDQLTTQAAQVRRELELEVSRVREQKLQEMEKQRDAVRMAEKRAREAEEELAQLRYQHKSSNEEMHQSFENLRKTTSQKSIEELFSVMAERDALQARYNALLRLKPRVPKTHGRVQQNFSIHSDRDTLLERCENEREFAMALATEERATLNSQISILKDSVTELERNLSRTRAQSTERFDVDKALIEKMRDEMGQIREANELKLSEKESEMSMLKRELSDLEKQNFALGRDTMRLNSEMSLLQESNENLKNDVSDANRAVSKMESMLEDVKRTSYECTARCEELQHMNHELRESNNELVKNHRKSESELVQAKKSVDSLKSQVDKLKEENETLSDKVEGEMTINQASREKIKNLEMLQKQYMHLESGLQEENQLMLQETVDLKARINVLEDREALLKNDIHRFKEEKSDAERRLASLMTSLQQKNQQFDQMQKELISREKSTEKAVNHWHEECVKLEESKRFMENELAKAGETARGNMENLHQMEFDLRKSEEEKTLISDKLEQAYDILSVVMEFRLGYGDSPNLARVKCLSESRLNDCITPLRRNKSLPMQRVCSSIKVCDMMEPGVIRESVHGFIQMVMEMEQDREALRQEIHNLQVKLSDTTELTSANEKIAQLQSSCVELRRERSEYDAWSENLVNELAKSEKEMDLVKMERANLQNELDHIKSNFCMANSKLDQYAEELTELRRFQQQQASLENNVKLSELKKLREAGRRSESLRKDLQSKLQEKNELAENLLMNIKMLESELKKLKMQMVCREQKNTQHEEKLKQQETSMGQLLDEKDKLENSCQRMQQKIAKLGIENNLVISKSRALQDRVHLQAEEICNLKEILSRLRNNLQHNKLQHNVIQDSSHQLQMELREKTNEMNRLSHDCKRQETKLKEREAHINELHDRINQLNSEFLMNYKLTNTQAERSNLLAKTEALEQAIEELTVQGNTLKKTNQRLQTQNNNMNQKIEKHDRETKHLRDSLAVIARERNELDHWNKKHSNDSFELRKTVTRLQQHIRTQDNDYQSKLDELCEQKESDLHTQDEQQKIELSIMEQEHKLKEQKLMSRLRLLENN